MIEIHTATLIIPFDARRWEARGPEGEGSESDLGRTRGQAQKLRVLVVDDEAAIADTLVEILNSEGFDALGASTGEGAIELVEDFQPDIVISDVVIPGINGVEVGIRIRELLPRCRVILFSGQAATVDLLKQARERGHEFEILAKPIRPEALLSIIRSRGPMQ